MSTAASNLADLFERWTVPKGQSITGVRETNDGRHPIGAYQEIVTALRLLHAIESILGGLRQLDASAQPFIDCLPAWYDAIIQCRYDWAASAGGDQPCISDGDLRSLRMLDAYLRYAGLPDVGTTTDLSELEAALSSARDLIIHQPGLNTSARAYLLGLVDEAIALLSNANEYGGDLIRQITHELSGAMHTTADSGVLPQEAASKWRNLAKKVAITVIVPPIAAIGAAVGNAAADRMLPSGSATPPTTIVNVNVDRGHGDQPDVSSP